MGGRGAGTTGRTPDGGMGPRVGVPYDRAARGVTCLVALPTIARQSMKSFASAYNETLAALTAPDFSSDQKWTGVLRDLRLLVQANGFSKGKRASVDDLRMRVKSDSRSGKECDGIIAGGGWGANGAVCDASTANKLGALKLLRHTYSVTNLASHKVWVVSTPSAMREWPIDAYAGKQSLAVKTSLSDTREQFGTDDMRKLSKATQEGGAWCQKAMVVTAACLKGKGQGIDKIKRWFADEDNQGEAELAAIASELNAGFKRLAASMTKGSVILTDVPHVRGDVNSKIWRSEAGAVRGSAATDGINVVYVESAFFADRNVLSGKKNWTRILVHEMTHVELRTVDHRYAHDVDGMKPDRVGFDTDKCLENAESWAFFAADCAGALDKGTLARVLK